MSTFIGTDRVVVAVEDNNTVVLVVGRAVEHMVDLDMLEVGSPAVAADNSSAVAGIVAAVLGIVDMEDVVGGTGIVAVVAGIAWVAVYTVLPEWQQTLVVQVHDRAAAGWQQTPAVQVHDRVVAG